MPQKIVDFAEKLDFIFFFFNFTIFLSGDLAYYVIRPEKKSADHFIFFPFYRKGNLTKNVELYMKYFLSLYGFICPFTALRKVTKRVENWHCKTNKLLVVVDFKSRTLNINYRPSSSYLHLSGNSNIQWWWHTVPKIHIFWSKNSNLRKNFQNNFGARFLSFFFIFKISNSIIIFGWKFRISV